MRSPKRISLNRQSGITIAMTALLMLVLVAMAALAIDVGVAWTARTAAQHAADSAALAGAYTYGAPALDSATRIQNAANAASVTANEANVLGAQVNVSAAPHGPAECPATDNIVCVDDDNRRVTVTVAVPVQTYFAKIWSTFNVLSAKVHATAEAAEHASGSRCLKPFYLANSILRLPTEDPATAFASGHVIIKDGDITPYAKQYIQNEANFASSDPSSCAGTSGCPLDVWSQGSQQVSQWGLVDFSEGQNNAGVLACTITSCLQDCTATTPMFTCQDTKVGIFSGQKVGQVQKNVQDLIGYPNNDTFIDWNHFDHNGTVVEGSSDSLLSVIVYDDSMYSKANPFPNGTLPQLNLVGFGEIFMNEIKKGSKSSVFLVSAGGCGSLDSTQVGAGGPAGVPIRLVNVPEQ